MEFIEPQYIIAVVVVIVALLLIKKFVGCMARVVITLIALGIIALCLMLKEHPIGTLTNTNKDSVTVKQSSGKKPAMPVKKSKE